MCIHYGYVDMDGNEDLMMKKRRERLIITSRLQRWYLGTYTEIRQNKLGDMDKNGFKGIITEFALGFKHLK
jgi:hypothetical protein